MASLTLLPPTLPAYQAAFMEDVCKVYFTISKFNSSSDFMFVHVTVKEQKSGKSVVNSSGSFPVMNGVILNKPIFYDSNSEQFYIKLTNSDIRGGWTNGYLYKIQIRLSEVFYDDTSIPASSWAAQNANKFSEWSTICVTKKIGKITIEIPEFTYSSEDPEQVSFVSSLDFTGSYNCEDISESLYSYSINLYDGDNNLLEEGETTLAIDNVIEYKSKTLLEESEDYYILIKYLTKNKYSNEVMVHTIATFL